MSLFKNIANSRAFEFTIIGLILITAGLIAYEAYPQFMTAELESTFSTIHKWILGAFIAEAAIKILACGSRPLNYFKNSWNIFDFSLIVLSLLPITGQFAMVARVLRVFRVVRLVTIFPELRLIIETLLRSIPSMLNIIALMVIIFFVYGVAGYQLFHEHDPTHWRDLGYAILTLFRIVTLEDWTDVMYNCGELIYRCCD